MALDLKANTAVDVLIGPFVDSTDGNTDETGLTITQADVRLSKNGQNMAQKNDANACTHDELGMYNCPLDATDTNTEGGLVLVVHESGALPVRHEFNVMAEAAWDSLYAAKDTGYMDVNVKAVSEDTTSADNLELDYDGTGYSKANSTIGTCTTNTDMRGTDSAALASVVGALADAAAAGDPTEADTLVQYVKQLINILIGTSGIAAFPAEAAPANAVSLAEVIRAIHADVTGLNGDAMRGTNSANTTVPDAAGTAAGLHSTTDALITTVDTVVDGIQTDLSNGTDGLGALKTLIDAIQADLDNGTDGLGALKALIDTIDGIVDAILVDTGTTIPALIAALENISTAEVNAEVVDALGTDTLSELSQGAPSATPTIKTALMLLYMLARNKLTSTSSELALYADDGSTKVSKKTLSDDGTTFTEAEMVSGA